MNWNAIWNSFLFSWGFANVTDHVQIMFSLMCTTNWICCCWRLFVARLWNINHSVNWLLDVMNKSKIMRKMIFNRIDYNYFIRYFYTFRFEIIFNFRQIYLVISYLKFFLMKMNFITSAFLASSPRTRLLLTHFTRDSIAERGASSKVVSCSIPFMGFCANRSEIPSPWQGKSQSIIHTAKPSSFFLPLSLKSSLSYLIYHHPPTRQL